MAFFDALRCVMASWWPKAFAGLAAVVLVGCATPPGSVGLARAVAAAPVVAAVHVPAVVEHRAPYVSSVPPLGLEPTALAAPKLPDAALEPSADAGAHWTQRGLASWYGKKFNGRRTASGERFYATGLTAAHRTLPIPCYVRVRHVASGKEVIVRINDRGPFHSARVLDLSYAAAQKLGIVSQGSAEVEIERLSDDDMRVGSLAPR